MRYGLDSLCYLVLFTTPKMCLFLGNVRHALLCETCSEYCHFSEELPLIILFPRAKLYFPLSLTALVARSYNMQSLCMNRNGTECSASDLWKFKTSIICSCVARSLLKDSRERHKPDKEKKKQQINWSWSLDLARIEVKFWLWFKYLALIQIFSKAQLISIG